MPRLETLAIVQQQQQRGEEAYLAVAVVERTCEKPWRRPVRARGTSAKNRRIEKVATVGSADPRSALVCCRQASTRPAAPRRAGQALLEIREG